MANTNNDCAPISSNCVTWLGEDIPCLGIKHGDSISTLVAIIANKVCEISVPQDLSKLSLEGLLSICNQVEPVSLTLVSVLQLMIDNNVCLKDLIDAINERLNNLEGNSSLTLILNCLGTEDEFGNPVEIDENTLLQLLIDNICQLKSDIADINIKIVDLQTQINNIVITPEIIEPNITTCLDPISAPTSEHIETVATEICSIRTDVGTTANVQNALAKQVSDLDAKYITNPDWILSTQVNNLSKLINNLLVLALDHEERITNIENNCCALTCDHVTIGFSVAPNEMYNGLVLNFGNIHGTFIPSGFTDCGSKVTIIDADGTIVGPVLIQIRNDDLEDGPYEVEINVSALRLNADLTVNVESKFCNGSLVCVKCNSKKFSFFNSGCPACALLNDNETGDIVITYTLPDDVTEYTETIVPGQTGYINRFATITEITLAGSPVTAGSSGVLSDCFDFSTSHPST